MSQYTPARMKVAQPPSGPTYFSGVSGRESVPTSVPPNGNISKPITGETRYTLSCTDLSGTTFAKSATVRVIPTFQEI